MLLTRLSHGEGIPYLGSVERSRFQGNVVLGVAPPEQGEELLRATVDRVQSHLSFTGMNINIFSATKERRVKRFLKFSGELLAPRRSSHLHRRAFGKVLLIIERRWRLRMISKI